METAGSNEMRADAGRLVGVHGVVWLRRLDATIEDVWRAISTIEGLTQFWIVPPKLLELRPGGAFEHHWVDTVADVTPQRCLDFRTSRFELEPDGGGTLLAFLGRFTKDVEPPSSTITDVSPAGIDRVQPGGPGTPWSGVCAGWHRMVDDLEKLVDGRAPEHDYNALCVFYAGYLADLFRWKRTLPLAP